MIHKLRAGVYLLYNKYYYNPDQKAHFKGTANICYCYVTKYSHGG